MSAHAAAAAIQWVLLHSGHRHARTWLVRRVTRSVSTGASLRLVTFTAPTQRVSVLCLPASTQPALLQASAVPPRAPTRPVTRACGPRSRCGRAGFERGRARNTSAWWVRPRWLAATARDTTRGLLDRVVSLAFGSTRSVHSSRLARLIASLPAREGPGVVEDVVVLALAARRRSLTKSRAAPFEHGAFCSKRRRFVAVAGALPRRRGAGDKAR